MDSKEHRARQIAIAQSVPQPVYVATPKKTTVRRCEECNKVLTSTDIKAYRAESKDHGYPRICEDCAEKPEEKTGPNITIVEEPTDNV